MNPNKPKRPPSVWIAQILLSHCVGFPVVPVGDGGECARKSDIRDFHIVDDVRLRRFADCISDWNVEEEEFWSVVSSRDFFPILAHIHYRRGKSTIRACPILRVREHDPAYFRYGGSLALVVVLASVLGYRYFTPANPKQIESVAVLPFVNGSGDASLDYLSDGLSESLIDRLSQLPQLKVISRNSSFKYRGADVDIKDAAAKLGVRAVVTGKVARVGDDLMVRVEMIDAPMDRQIWSEQYQVKAADVLKVQREIAQQASENLRLRLTGEQEERLARPDTTNPQANEMLLKARFFNNKGGGDNRLKAVDFYEQAVAADPGYALAYSELADTYVILSQASLIDPKEGMPKAEAAAQKAVQLNNGLGEGHTAMGFIRLNNWDWGAAEREFRRALELNQNIARAHDGFSEYLSYMGHHDESIAEGRRASELSPLTLNIQRNYGARLLNARRFDEAIEAFRKVLELDPNYTGAHTYLGYTFAAKNMHKEAIEAYERAIGLGLNTSSNQIYLGASAARVGDRARAQEILKRLETSEEYVSPGELAILYTALGDREKALTTLERAYREHDLQLKYLTTEAGYDDLRSEPRFQELVRKVGLPVARYCPLSVVHFLSCPLSGLAVD